MTFAAFGGHTDSTGRNSVGGLAFWASNYMCTIVVHFSIPDSINFVEAAFSHAGIWIFFAYNNVSIVVVKGQKTEGR